MDPWGLRRRCRFESAKRGLGGGIRRPAAGGVDAKAEPLHQRALAMREKSLGPDHPDLAASQEYLASLYRAMKRDDHAEPLEKRVARIRAIKR